MSPTTTARRVPLSILDLAVVADGATGQDAIRASLDLAVRADALGYRRFWFAEHHLAPGVASAS
ncbi:LLM class flavin-dependent oxidoreductase, partial [Cellulomonas septica]|nr:LLM class flavin-dependent oxidoreductase [Cellulomonas septica]